MSSGIIPWTRQMELCSRWLEIIKDELPLLARLEPAQAHQLAVDARTLLGRAQALSEELDRIAETGWADLNNWTAQVDD